MSIELKQAAQQSTTPLQAVCRYISDVLAGDASSSEKHIARTIMHLLPLEQAAAIQQAESEPVAFIQHLRDHETGAEETELVWERDEDLDGPLYWYTPLYTHPAPGVPDQDWERKERLQSIADTAEASGLFGLAQKWANNEIHSYQFTHQAAAIVLKAMLAASPAQKGGE